MAAESRAPSNPFRNPPAIVVDGAQRALRLKTDRETMSIWRLVQADLRRTPRLTWEWKAVALPEGADVRKSGRNESPEEDAAGIRRPIPRIVSA